MPAAGSDHGPSSPVHIALVMNGGVSLAVWMGGVTHEIDRLRRSGDADAPASPAWQALCGAAKRQITVDYVAGTSAGGLNGSLLATAIARGAPLPDLRQLWRQEARLTRGKLLHARPQRPGRSVLDGEFFRETIGARVGKVPQGQAPQDVTLLVTASAMYGSSTAVTDAAGQRFTAGDHRRVYRFRRRANALMLHPNGKFDSRDLDDFENHPDELVLAARASAGFPFAFAPTRETPELHELNVTRVAGGPSWLVDGGVLDNAPFRPLLDELLEQPIEDPGPRWIVYVVPSKQAAPQRHPAGPGAAQPEWTSLPGRIWSLSRESDLRDDVVALERDWRESTATVHPPEFLIGLSPGERCPIDLDKAAQALWEAYRRTRASAIVARLLREPGNRRLSDEPTDLGALDELLRRGFCWIPTSVDTPGRAMGEPPRVAWQWGDGAARRIARWVARDARGVTGREPLPAEDRSQLTLIEEELLAISHRLETLRRHATEQDGLIAGHVAAANAATVSSGLLPVALDLMTDLVDIWSPARGLESRDDAWRRVFAVEVVQSALQWRQAGAPPPFAFHLLSPDSPHHGSILALGDEADPELSKGWPDNKLYGTRFGHFGAFGTDDFRDWDWMWGRLDAALTLAPAILHDAHGSTADEKQGLINDVVEEILTEHGRRPEEIQSLTAVVVGLRSGQLVAQARASNQTDFDGVIDDIGALLVNNPLITRAARGGAVGRFKGRVRGWAVKRVIGLGTAEAKRLVAKQRI
jgi:predicted acylesterase/phospholipase RssA